MSDSQSVRLGELDITQISFVSRCYPAGFDLSRHHFTSIELELMSSWLNLRGVSDGRKWTWDQAGDALDQHRTDIFRMTATVRVEGEFVQEPAAPVVSQLGGKCGHCPGSHQ